MTDWVDEIEAREKLATTGPWYVEYSDDPEEPGCVFGIHSPAEDAQIVKTDTGVYPPDFADAEFIAHAREDVPRLVAEVRRLRALLTPGAPCSCSPYVYCIHKGIAEARRLAGAPKP